MSAFKQDPNNPLIALLLGLTFIHLGCQKFSAKKNSLVVQVIQKYWIIKWFRKNLYFQQSCAFLNQYLQLRGPCQESYFNLGRAMHQLGILHAALHYYKKALEMESNVENDPQGLFDLKRETAFNVALIYKASGSERIARMYLNKYIVI